MGINGTMPVYLPLPTIEGAMSTQAKRVVSPASRTDMDPAPVNDPVAHPALVAGAKPSKPEVEAEVNATFRA